MGPLAGEAPVLDVGCGGGWLLEEISASGVKAARLHGVDLLEPRVEVARRRVAGAEIRRADAAELPFEDGRFELVLMLTALSSMGPRTMRAALAEARRVLAPGGRALVYEPRFANPFNRATERVSMEDLEHGLGPATKVVHLTGMPPVARRLGRSAPRLYAPLSRALPTHRLTRHEPGGFPRPPG